MLIAAFGEIMLRLSPPSGELPLQSPTLKTYVAGAEANVLSQLARLGHEARMLSAVPDNAWGHGALGKLREQGVDTSRVLTGEGRLGLYFVTTGAGVRSSHVVYDRDATTFQAMSRSEWDWNRLLDGVEWLHVSGINAALSATTEQGLRDAMDAARSRGAKISFDCNYRQNLWDARSCDPVPVLKELIAKADFLFGNHRDISLLSGERFDGTGTERRRESALRGFEMFPDLDGMASTARHAHGADNHRLSARLDRPDSFVQTEEVHITGIVDRIGSGDAFCAGVLDGLLAGRTDEHAARTGLALAVLKHTLPGDAALFSRSDIAAYATGSFDVRR